MHGIRDRLSELLEEEAPAKIEELYPLFKECGRRFSIAMGPDKVSLRMMTYGFVPNYELDIPEDTEAIYSTLDHPQRTMARAFVLWELNADYRRHLNPYVPILQFFRKSGRWGRMEMGVLYIFDAWGGSIGLVRL